MFIDIFIVEYSKSKKTHADRILSGELKELSQHIINTSLPLYTCGKSWNHPKNGYDDVRLWSVFVFVCF